MPIPRHLCIGAYVKENSNLDAVNLEMLLYLTKNSAEKTFFLYPFLSYSFTKGSLVG